MRLRTLVQFSWILLLVASFVLPVQAQDDPTTRIVELATQVHIQNLRSHSITRWIGGDLGRADGSEIGAEAGTQFTNWEFTDLYDESHHVDASALERPVLMNIWASWCGPCRFEFPFLTNYALSGTTNYDLWFLNANDTGSAARRFLQTQAEGITVYVDDNDFFIANIGLRVFPTTVLMDTDGTILAAHSGVVTRTVMEFFDAVAAHPREGSLDTSTVPTPDLSALLGPIDPADATPIVYGQQVAGEINDENWLRTYRIEGEANQEIILTMQATGEDLDAYLVIIGPDGERVAENDDSGNTTNSEIRLTLPATGTYVIVATRFLERDGFGSGGFNLQVITAEQAANGGGNTTNIIPLGIPLSGRLTYDYKQQSYLLEATAGQVLTFSLTHDTPEEQLNIQVRLGAGERLVPFTKTENGELTTTVEVATTGTYSVYVARPQASRADPITYTLIVTAEGEVTPPSTDQVPDDLTLSYGETVTGTLDNTAFEQRYTFEGTAGDVVSVDMTMVVGSGNLDTTLTLLDPAGEIIAENDDVELTTTNSRLSEISLPTTGTYTLVATRFDGENGFTSGDYELTLVATSSGGVEPVEPVGMTGDLNYGDSITSTLNDEVFSETHTFTANAGDVVTIEAALVTGTGNLDTNLKLLDAEGNILAENDDIELTTTNSRIADFILPDTGTYSIVVSRYLGADGATTGDYTLTLTLVAGAEPTGTGNDTPPTIGGVDTGEAVTLSYGDTASGVLDAETYQVLYAFTGQAGDVVTIAMQAAVIDSNLDSRLMLLGPDGSTVLAENDDFDFNSLDARIENFELPESGTYTVVATRFDAEAGLSSGDFTLSLVLAAEGLPTPPVATNDSVLEYGASVRGAISNTTYEVEYTFQGSAGDVVSISMTATAGDLDPLLVLYGPFGEVLNFNDDVNTVEGNYNSALVFRLPQDGEYMILATRFDGDMGGSTGEFVLDLQTTSDTMTVIALGYGESATGYLDNTQYEQHYTFNGVAGDVITIEMTASSSDLDPLLILYSSDNEELIRNDDININQGIFDARISRYSLPETGTYTIAASRFDGALGSSNGDYVLTLSIAGGVTQEPTGGAVEIPTTTAAEVRYGDTLTGSLSADNLEDRYVFQAEVGDVVTIVMNTTSGNLDTYLSVLNAAGEELAFNDNHVRGATQDSRIRIKIREAGAYTIVATRYGVYYGKTSGDYELTIGVE